MPSKDGYKQHDSPWRLTPREEEMRHLLAKGLSNQAIAEQMVITIRGVEGLINSVFSKSQLFLHDLQRHRRVTLARMVWDDEHGEGGIASIDDQLKALIAQLETLRAGITWADDAPRPDTEGVDTSAVDEGGA